MSNIAFIKCISLSRLPALLYNISWLYISFIEYPWSVENPQVHNINANSISISWLPPAFDGYSPITKYTIQLFDNANNIINNSCQSTLINDNCVITSTSTTYDNLSPYTQYYLRIWATNNIGNSGIVELSVRTNESGNKENPISIIDIYIHYRYRFIHTGTS